MDASTSPRRRRFAAFLVLVLLHAPFTGCAQRGSNFAADKIPRIEKGVTTREEVDGWFGRPITVKQSTSGFATYRYLHEETTSRDTGLLTRIGAFVAGFFGYGGYGSPVNVRYKNTVRHELVVLFDLDGVVQSYGYERTEIPSKQIY